MLDVSRQSISKWENDKAYPEMTRLLFMSDYFEVSLDYLMRGVETGKAADEAAPAYKAGDLLRVWNTFLSNLSGRQRALLLLLYGLTVCILVAVLFAFLYGGGYAIGQLIGHIAG